MDEWEARMRKATADPRLPPTVRADFVSALACVDALRNDAERLDWMSQYEARVGWNREGDLCRVWVRDEDEGTEQFKPACGWDKFFNTHREAIDAAMQAERNSAAA